MIVHILGIRRSGVAAAKLLKAHGVDVIASDSSDTEELRGFARELIKMGVKVWLGGHTNALKEPFDLAVISPGIPLTAPVVHECHRLNVTVISELELGWRYSQGLMIAVTGTNGKSTVTSLTGHLFASTGRESFTCGNIGVPFCSIADQTHEDSCIAIEVSSYQLGSIARFRPQIAMIMNLTPDHVSWHGSVENYYRTKATIWRNQKGSDWLIYFFDDANCRALIGSANSQQFPFSVAGSFRKGAFLEDNQFVVRRRGYKDFRLPRSALKLPGIHNAANGLAAISAAVIGGLEYDQIAAGVESFTGLPHRLERVGEINGVTYINDSKATNVDAGKWALMAFDGELLVIAGGQPKGGGFLALRSFISGKVVKMYLIGDAADEIARDLGDLAPYELSGDLPTAVEQAHRDAKPGQTVLLVPFCASFDQFRDFEQRGDRFRELVKGLVDE